MTPRKSAKPFDVGGSISYEVLGGRKSGGSEQVLRLQQPFLLASPLYSGATDFGFDRVFLENSTQEEVFENVLEPVLDVFFGGINSCICCYGQTGTGKTWTMSGGDLYASRGLVQRALENLFTRSSDSCTILISYMEIYNEVAYDLLGVSEVSTDIDAFPRVTLQDDETGTLNLRNLSLHAVSTVEEAVDLFLFGNVNRIVSSTVMNEASSRSHCVLTVHLETKSEGSFVRTSKLHLVDLAGSERVWKSRLTQTDLTEAKHINKSLHFLEQVMQSLFKKRAHIPYRNSVLTSVLRDALGGNCKTVLIGNISTETCNFKETIATCRFLQRCGQIEVTTPRVTEKVNDWKRYAEKVEVENSKLKGGADRKKISLPLKPASKFIFEQLADIPRYDDVLTLRDLQEQCGSNLSLFPKEFRKQLIERVRADGMDYRVSCVGDLCALIQVLIAKLTQSDSEKKELRDRLKAFVESPISAPVSTVLTINLSESHQWKQSNPETD